MLLFLDFDGVIHPSPCPGVDMLFCRLPLLQDWLRRRPGVDVVISSSWREHHPLDEMRSYFDANLQPRILGATPLASLLYHDRHAREAEVRRWLADSPDPNRPWAALDDNALLYRPEAAELVVCDPTTGLTEADLAKLDQVLGILE